MTDDDQNINASTQLAKSEKALAQSKLAELRSLFEKARPSMDAVATSYLTPDKLTKIALVAIGKTPKLLKCTSQSILRGVMTAAQLGLDCSGVLGSAYLVPFDAKNGRTEAQLIIGYRGLIMLARRSGEISTIQAHVVCKGDRFEFELGLDPRLSHVPSLEGGEREITHAYMVAHLKDGGVQVEVMTKADIDRIRSRSRSGGAGPWVTDYKEMARKTVVRRGMKYLPLTTEVREAVAVDEEVEFTPTEATLVDEPEWPAEKEPEPKAIEPAPEPTPEPIPETSTVVEIDGETLQQIESENPLLIGPVHITGGGAVKGKHGAHWNVDLSDGRRLFTADEVLATTARDAKKDGTAVLVEARRGTDGGFVLTAIQRADA